MTEAEKIRAKLKASTAPTNNRQPIEHKIENLFRMTQPTLTAPPKQLCGPLWAETELFFLFGEDGTCKSIFAVQTGCAIASGISIKGFPCEVVPQPVAYFDVELSDRQFNSRYPTPLHENFVRFTFNEDQQAALVHAQIGDVVAQIKQCAETIGAKIIMLDNISALSAMLDSSKSTDSIVLMGLLNELKKQGYSILVVDHSRKPAREGDFKVLSKHDLQGSKMKSNLSDSVAAIGKSCQDENMRYIKALKIRSYGMAFTGKAVATMELKTGPLRLEYIGLNGEWEHVNDRAGQVFKMTHEGKTQKEIADEIGISQQGVSKILTKCPF